MIVVRIELYLFGGSWRVAIVIDGDGDLRMLFSHSQWCYTTTSGGHFNSNHHY